MNDSNIDKTEVSPLTYADNWTAFLTFVDNRVTFAKT